MTQPDGLSPRLNITKQLQQQQQKSATSTNLTPTSTSVTGSAAKFFGDDHPATAHAVPSRSDKKNHRRSPSRSSTVPPSSNAANRKRSTLRILGSFATLLAVVPWLYVRGGTSSSPQAAKPSLRALAEDVGAESRCALRRSWGGLASKDRELCSGVVPRSVVEARGWLVAVHVDRKPSSYAARGGSRLRGSAPRNLPHQYFARALDATLRGIAAFDPGAKIDVVIFTEGRWGGIVDDMGVPVKWDIPAEICSELGLHCSQVLALLNDKDTVADALECAGVADVFVGSESDFSQASVPLSPHVKVLTDRWQTDEDEMVIALNPATTVAGVPPMQRHVLKRMLWEYKDCSALVSS